MSPPAQGQLQQMREYAPVQAAYAQLMGIPYHDAPLDPSIIEFRLKAIATHYRQQDKDMLEGYLAGLGAIRNKLKAALKVLHTNGKKKYEEYIRRELSEFDNNFAGLDGRASNLLRGLLDIPFRRGTAKDDAEIKVTLWAVTNRIIDYRRQFSDRQIEEYAATVTSNVDNETIPPAIASLIMTEVSELVDCAVKTNVFAYVDTGLTCAEFVSMDDCIEAPPANKLSPQMHDPIHGIAEQSVWYGGSVDTETVDDLIVSLVGGLLYQQCPSMCPLEE
ncbi:hypothetical protein QRT53_001869 [Salmonella enterica]|nr:hypothetical protein [Salmonella enterica]